jgi:lipoprotein-releasing system ATP-binding protein
VTASPTIAADLVVDRVSKSYATAAGELEVLREVSLAMRRGEALAVTGPSGTGKSTLLYIIGTLEFPGRGSVQILGQDPFSLAGSALARFRNQHIGFVFQDHFLLPQLSVLENVLIPALAGAGARRHEEQRARELLARVGLDARIDHRPAQLSGGERQRVAICRALINGPTVVLADEPTGNLDRQSAREVGTLLLELASEHRSVLVVVTHSLELAERFPRRCELMEGGLMETAVPELSKSEPLRVRST